jgi:hypothetical protein
VIQAVYDFKQSFHNLSICQRKSGIERQQLAGVRSYMSEEALPVAKRSKKKKKAKKGQKRSKKEAKTYNSRDSLVVTHPTTDLPI